MLGYFEFQHLCPIPNCKECTRGPRPHDTLFAETQDAERSPPTAPSHRGAPRLPTQDVILAQAHTPLPMGSGILHAPRLLRLTVHTPRGEGGRDLGGPGPQAKNKGSGAAHARREPRGRAQRPSPAGPGPREMAAGLQNGSRVGMGVEA